MMKKRWLAFGLLIPTAISLTGCSGALANTSALTFNQIAAQKSQQMTASDEEKYVYSYITDRIKVDINSLSKASDSDVSNISNLMNNVNTCLQGNMASNALSPAFANYLLMEFSKTPYEWQYTGDTVLGYDPASRLYFVDATYRTNGSLKSVVPNDSIVAGDPNESAEKAQRYKDYMDYMSAMYSQLPSAGALGAAFQAKWGSMDNVINSQTSISLLQRIQKFGNPDNAIGKYVYSGVSNSSDRSGASMTLRFVLDYQFNIGQQQGMEVKSAYIKDYKVDDADSISSQAKSTGNVAGSELLTPIISTDLDAYYRAVEEGDQSGLYKLFDNYGDWAKYYKDIADYSYSKYLGYTFKILSNNNGVIQALVTRTRNVRAKGSNMSYPTYNEQVLMTFKESGNDSLKIENEEILSTSMLGEPLSVIQNVTGVSNKMLFTQASFTADNKKAVLSTMANFTKAEVDSTSSSMGYLDYVDKGINQTKLNNMMTTLNSLQPTGIMTWIVGFNSQSNMYCNLTLRQVIETSNGTYDTQANMELVNDSGSWGIIGFERTMSVKIQDVNTNSYYSYAQKGKDLKFGSAAKTSDSISNAS